MPVKITKQIISVIVSIVAFTSMVTFLNIKGLIPDNAPEVSPSEPENSKKEPTDIQITDVDINGTIITASDGDIYSYNLETNTKTTLVTDPANLAYPGVLSDGRVYFWQSSTLGENPVYSYLYIQNGSSFDRYHLPLITSDSGRDPKHPPLITSDGSKVYFTSDRDSENNLKRKSLYVYDLNTFALTKLTNNALMSVQQVFLSPDGVFIGLTYQNYEVGKDSDDTSLGMIMVGAPTVNLYPHLIVDAGPISFTTDSKKVIFNSHRELTLFNITTGKIAATQADHHLITYTNAGIVIAVSPHPDQLIDFLDACPDPARSTLPVNTLVKLTLTDTNTFEVQQEFTPQSVLVTPLLETFHHIATDQGNQILVSLIDQEHCEPIIAVADFDRLRINGVDLSRSDHVFWVD